MARVTLTDRVTQFVESEMAGGGDKADIAKALKAAAGKLIADTKPEAPASTGAATTKPTDTTKP